MHPGKSAPRSLCDQKGWTFLQLQKPVLTNYLARLVFDVDQKEVLMSTRSLPVRVRVRKTLRLLRSELGLTWARLRDSGAPPESSRPLEAVAASPPALGLREEAHELVDHFADDRLAELVQHLERLYREETDELEMEAMP